MSIYDREHTPTISCQANYDNTKWAYYYGYAPDAILENEWYSYIVLPTPRVVRDGRW
jgi:hypothetical protein